MDAPRVRRLGSRHRRGARPGCGGLRRTRGLADRQPHAPYVWVCPGPEADRSRVVWRRRADGPDETRPRAWGRRSPLPQFLPESQAVLFTITATTGGNDASRVATLDLRTGTQKILVSGGSQAQYVPSGHLVYAASGTLRAVGFDLKRLEVIETPIPVVPQVLTMPNGTAEFDVARDGTLVYVPSGTAAAPARTLIWVDRQGHEGAIKAAPARVSR
jgi:hypothetical protein